MCRPPRIRPGLSGSNFFLSDTDSGRDFGWYLFGGVEGRAVAHNLFLDGNTFAKSLSVQKKTFVADFQGGRLTTDAGALLLREVEETIGLFDALNAAIPDPRNPVFIIHD